MNRSGVLLLEIGHARELWLRGHAERLPPGAADPDGDSTHLGAHCARRSARVCLSGRSGQSNSVTRLMLYPVTQLSLICIVHVCVHACKYTCTCTFSSERYLMAVWGLLQE